MLTKNSKVNRDKVQEIYDSIHDIGVGIDLDQAQAIHDRLTEESLDNLQKASQMLEGDFRDLDLTKTSHLKEALLNQFNYGKYAGKTAKGNPSFNAVVLERIYNETGNPFVMYIRNFRSKKSLASKITEIAGFVDNSGQDLVHPKVVYGDTNRATFTEPALSNIHKELRPMIVPRKDKVFIKADFKAQEILLQINMLGIDQLKDVYQNYDDFYTGMVKELTGVDLRQEYRENIKLAWISGIYNSSLTDLQCTPEERKLVERIKEEVHNIPQVEKFRQYVEDEIIAHKKPIVSYFGTERPFPSYLRNKRRIKDTVFNNIFQITGSDILYFALEGIQNKIDFLGYTSDQMRVALTIHDEIILEVSKDLDIFKIEQMFKEQMSLQVEGWAKFKVETEISESY